MANKLTIRTITREFIRLLSCEYPIISGTVEAPVSSTHHYVDRGLGDWYGQDTSLGPASLYWDLEEFSEKFLAPMAKVMVLSLAPGLRFNSVPLELPYGCVATNEQYEGASFRGLISYMIIYDQDWLRFDCRTLPGKR